MTTWAAWATRTSSGRLWHVDIDRRVPEIAYQALPRHYTVVPVTVTEDPAGDWVGWRPAGHPDAECPARVYHRDVFRSVPVEYHPETLEARGEGRLVRLTVTDR